MIFISLILVSGLILFIIMGLGLFLFMDKKDNPIYDLLEIFAIIFIILIPIISFNYLITLTYNFMW